jgi:heme o synthase
VGPLPPAPALEEAVSASPRPVWAKPKRGSASSRLFQTANDYLSLAKPGVIALLLVSTVCPMILAGGGNVPLSLLVWTTLGGAFVSASAGAINCIWDRDIDQVMRRTMNRPLPTGRLENIQAIFFAILTGIAGLLMLYSLVSPKAAFVALCGHLFYVLVYTMWLKRSTPQNIVIGGAAGAIPPLVGWVAVTGTLNFTALMLFLVVFLWTPPHFWALAINKNDDYRRANVPMLPVVRGEAETVRQMWIYAALLVPASILLVITTPLLSLLSFAVLTSISLYFLFKVELLRRSLERGIEEKTKRAWEVFGFSLVYLALFFVTLTVDSIV